MASPESSPESKTRRGAYEPTLIIHGGAGAIRRSNLPPALYEQYRRSLASYLTQTKAQLDAGASALDAATFAVSLLEDDPLFNCGRGSVFTMSGHIEMEASVMVTSVRSDGPHQGGIKRTGAVSRIRNTRHPIQLARQVLLRADEASEGGSVRDMHGHLNGHLVEEWGWLHHGLEAKEDNWFWTQRRWDEHRRGLEKGNSDLDLSGDDDEEPPLPSQGTVGCVCFDSHGDLAVATSTGGLTNKLSGRVGDTPSVGAGFWAESWPTDKRSEYVAAEKMRYSIHPASTLAAPSPLHRIYDAVRACMPSLPPSSRGTYAALIHNPSPEIVLPSSSSSSSSFPSTIRAVALSGTGNGDSFLRVAAARTVGAQCRFTKQGIFKKEISLQRAATNMAGPGGELQRSAGERWSVTGEGEGGLIGIDASQTHHKAQVVADFNCGGMWRAWFADVDGKEVVRVRVFRDDDEEEGSIEK